MDINILKKRDEPCPENWGLRANLQGELMFGNLSAAQLAEEFGTPLHVINEERLKITAVNFNDVFSQIYPGKVSIHYAFKCNSVPMLVNSLKESGIKSEVMSEFELDLALNTGYFGKDIIVNGHCKTSSLLKKCIINKVKLIIVDSIEELRLLEKIVQSSQVLIKILLRINPDFASRRINSGAASSSRAKCAFGLDLRNDEIGKCFSIINKTKKIMFSGFHFHLGTGIKDPKQYSKCINKLAYLIRKTRSEGMKISVLDVGGGFPSPTSREFNNLEMMLYQSFSILPKRGTKKDCFSLATFAQEISKSIIKYFPSENLPELILEPGRSLVSQNQTLLLSINQIKKRNGVPDWIITDGGISTVNMPLIYEWHEILLGNDLRRPKKKKVNIIGKVCFASDLVYKNKLMPQLNPGEILAVMDSGAYFLSWESSFGFPKSSIVCFNRSGHRQVRRPEIYSDMICRDLN